jgi:hypothetical protein
MPTPDFALKRGDRKPSVQVELADTDGTAIVLPAGTSTVRWHMRTQDGQWLIVGTATVVSLGTADPLTPAVLRYDWAAGDTDRPGLWDAEFSVELPGGVGFETFPGGRDLLVAIREDVA